ncbi:fibronectin type III domain-containing protein [Marinitoga aeolica]|uniref:Fibronectin type-III domain-containing protein n=1 Tax=Marinitoga aeolica TaxID=2809031 RepID=A0ABY8PNG9_9BACT|nr:hypothetical protein [Marinitoga aeolica]WGS64187.1 hypothetical protein JRV97_07335 [Marinitoga aeolica]
MKKLLFYILLISLFLLLNSCVFKVRPPKAILTYPTNFNNLPTSIDLFWTLEGSEKNDDFNFEIYYGKSETSFDNKISTSNTFTRLENLEPENEYYIKIRTIKGNEYTDSEIYKIKTTDKPEISFIIDKTTIYKNYVELRWSGYDKDGIKKYELYKSTTPDFSDKELSYSGKDTSFRLEDLSYGKTYYIKLIAFDNIDESSEKVLVINVADFGFYNFYPSNNEKSVPINEVTLKWDYTINSNYILLFSTSSSFDDGKYYKQIETSKNSYTIKNLPPGTTFYWEVIDKNNSFKSPILTFTTSYKPEIEITYPIKNTEIENYAIGIPVDTKITWNATDADDDDLTYNIKLKNISENPEIDIKNIDFSTDLLIDEKIKNNFYDVQLKKNQYYALQILADDNKGNIAKSNIIKFRTNSNPAKPYDLYPNNKINIPTDIATLTWESYDIDNNKLTYNIYFGNSADNIAFKENINHNYYILHNLDYGKIYYWQVEAIDSNNATSISDIATFMTNEKPIFKDISPENNEKNINLMPELKWNFEDPDDEILYYNLYFSKSSESLSLIATLTENRYKFNYYLFPQTTYKWEVVAYDSKNASATSKISYFTTTSLPEIELKSPKGNNVSLKPVFTWSSTDTDNDELEYTLNLVFPDKTITKTTKSTSLEYDSFLLPDTEYSWSVLVRDSNMATIISATQTFKTTHQPTITLTYPISEENLGATVTLKWNSYDPDNDNLYYKIYLDDTEIATTTNSNYTLTDLTANKTYIWKVMTIDSNFATSISDESTFTTDSNPFNNPDITNIYDYYDPSKEYTFNENKYPNKMKIKWLTSSNAIYYNVYKEKDGIETPIATNVTENYTTINIPEGGIYNIYVKAFNNKGFYLKGNSIALNINEPPILLDFSPQNNETNIPLTPKIIWNADDHDSSTFNIYIYFGETVNNLNSEYISNANGTNDYTINKILKPGTTYYWKLKLEDEMHGVTETNFRKFTTTYKPHITFINLSSGSTNVSLNTNITWNATDNDGDPLTFDINLSRNGYETLKATTSNNDYSLKLLSNSNYILKITVKDDKGSSDSTEITFSTTKAPIIYNDSLRSDSLDHMKNGNNVYWNAYDQDGDDLTYEVYLGTSKNNLNLIGSTTLSEYSLTNLEYNQTYYWKIIAYDDKGGKTESEIKSFKTNAVPVFEEDKFYPSNNALGVEKNVTLKWNASDNDNDTLKYDLYFGTNKLNLTKIATDYIYNSYNLSSLTEGLTYYWKVIAKDYYDGYAVSDIMSFTVNKAPSIPNITYVLQNGLESTISWKAYDPEGQNLTYDLLISSNGTDYSTVLYNTTQLEYYAKRLKPNSTYYWKLRAIDSKESKSENIISFKTEKSDTNIFTIERGNTSEKNEIINALDINNEIIAIQKDNSNYTLIKFDSSGTETSSVLSGIDPKLLDYYNSNIIVTGINSGKVSFEEYNDSLTLKNATPTNIDATSIKDHLRLSDGSYIIIGNNSGNSFISKVNLSNGSTLLNTVSYSDITLNAIIGITDEDSNKKFIIIGASNNQGYILKTDENFNKESEKTLDDIDALFDVEDTKDGFIVSGFKNNNLIIKKYSYRLNEEWTPIYENNFKNNFAKILKNDDGYIIILNNNNGDIEVIKTDKSLNVIKKSTFGRENEDIANGIIKASDNGYIIFGSTKSFSDTENGNAYLIKTDSNLIGWNTPE